MKPDSIEEVTMESSISQVEVRDMQGRLVLQTENYENINRLSRGMYIRDDYLFRWKSSNEEDLPVKPSLLIIFTNEI